MDINSNINKWNLLNSNDDDFDIEVDIDTYINDDNIPEKNWCDQFFYFLFGYDEDERD